MSVTISYDPPALSLFEGDAFCPDVRNRIDARYKETKAARDELAPYDEADFKGDDAILFRGEKARVMEQHDILEAITNAFQAYDDFLKKGAEMKRKLGVLPLMFLERPFALSRDLLALVTETVGRIQNREIMSDWTVRFFEQREECDMLYAFSFVLVPLAVRQMDASLKEELEGGSYTELRSEAAQRLWAAFGISDTYTYHFKEGPFASYATLGAVFRRVSKYLKKLQDFDQNRPIILCERKMVLISALNATLAMSDLCRRRAHAQH